MYLTDLADVLRAAGCVVIEYDGWKTRGRQGQVGGIFEPRAVIMHHDGSPIGPAQPPENYARFLFVTGRPSEGIPAPLCNAWVDYYGRWWVGAAGRANHAGTGSGWGTVPANRGNDFALGIEMDNTINEPTTKAQYEALHKGLPAIFKHYGWDVSKGLTSHKEYAPGRKFDPDDIDMNKLRNDVLHSTEGDEDMTPEEHEWLRWLRAEVGNAVGQGQTSFSGTIKATLGGVQSTYNFAKDAATKAAELLTNQDELEQIVKDAMDGLPPGAGADEIAAAVVKVMAEKLGTA